MKRVALTLVVTGLCTAYILWKIDLGKTGHVLATARIGWWLLSLGIMVASVFPMAWRWQPGWMVWTSVFSVSLAMGRVAKGRSGRPSIF